MVDHYRFHLARAEAERLAAGRAASEPTRALHLELATLHLDRAVALEADDLLVVSSVPPPRLTWSASPSLRLPDAASPA